MTKYILTELHRKSNSKIHYFSHQHIPNYIVTRNKGNVQLFAKKA